MDKSKGIVWARAITRHTALRPTARLGHPARVVKAAPPGGIIPGPSSVAGLQGPPESPFHTDRNTASRPFWTPSDYRGRLAVGVPSATAPNHPPRQGRPRSAESLGLVTQEG